MSKLVLVVLCGGDRLGLWPIASPERPKPFQKIIRDRSLFTDTLDRLSTLSFERIVVVADRRHEREAREQSARLTKPVQLVLEPEARGTAPAVIAASHLLSAQSDAVAVFVAADHYVGDASTFCTAVTRAAEIAATGLVVTLGVLPDGPRTSCGYIEPGEQIACGVSAIARFVDEVDVDRACRLVHDGALWNSGNFVARPSDVLSEARRLTPDLVSAVVSSFEAFSPDLAEVRLGHSFLDLPTESFGRAIMTRSDLNAVVPSDFGWSEVSSWAAVLEVSEKDENGNSAPPDAVVEDCQDVLIRVPDGLQIATLGLENLAIVATGREILICSLDHARSVTTMSARFSGEEPGTANFERSRDEFECWFRRVVFPHWWSFGGDAKGGFHEALNKVGEPEIAPRRFQLQARLGWLFGVAERERLPGMWLAAHRHAKRFLADSFHRIGPGEHHSLEDDASLLLLLSSAYAIGDTGLFDADPKAEAEEALLRISVRYQASGQYAKAGKRLSQSEAHLRLLQAAVEWRSIDDDPLWRARLRGFIAFIEGGGLVEQTAAGVDGVYRHLEDGWPRLATRSFEWASVLHDATLLEGPDDHSTAKRLYQDGRRRQASMSPPSDPDRAIPDTTSHETDLLRLQIAAYGAALRFGEDDHASEALEWIKRELHILGPGSSVGPGQGPSLALSSAPTACLLGDAWLQTRKRQARDAC